MTLEEIYTPPHGIFFRLVGYASQYVLFSRTNQEPEVGQYPSAYMYDDQFFQVIPGSGEHSGLFAIKGKASEKVLFSRNGPDPNVGHIDGDGYYNDNWFKLEPGTGKFAKYFRLVTPTTGMTLFSRTNQEPNLGNYPAYTNYPDQYFSFLFEDMNIDKIDYDLNLGKILSSTPLVLANQTLTNESDQDQQMSFSLSQTVTHTSSFDYTLGFTIGLQTKFKAGVPLVAEAEFTVSATLSNTFHWGQQESFAQSYTASFPVKAGPHETVRAVSTVNTGTLEVPYTIHLSSKTTGAKTESKGIWRGVSSWDLRHTITKVDKSAPK